MNGIATNLWIHKITCYWTIPFSGCMRHCAFIDLRTVLFATMLSIYSSVSPIMAIILLMNWRMVFRPKILGSLYAACKLRESPKTRLDAMTTGRLTIQSPYMDRQTVDGYHCGCMEHITWPWNQEKGDPEGTIISWADPKSAHCHGLG